MNVVMKASAIALAISLVNLTFMFEIPNNVFFATRGSLLTTAVAALASGVSMIVLPKHRWYGVAIGLNIVAALLGALSVAMLFTARDGHPPAADLLAILSAAICGATIPLGLSEGRQNSH